MLHHRLEVSRQTLLVHTSTHNPKIMIHQLVIEYIWDVFKTFQGENVCTSEINIIIALVIIPKKKSSFTLERVFKRI